MKKKRNNASDIDHALAAAGSVKSKNPKTEEPIAEKDEVKMAEEALRKQLKKQK
jgi:hypothetical protein